MTPASTMPAPPPMPMIVDINPIEPATRSRGNSSRMIPKARGKMPPPAPWMTRPMIIGAALDAIAETTVPTAMMPIETRSRRSLPYMSPRRPKIGVHTDALIRYEVSSHVAVVSETLSCFWISGSAGATSDCSSAKAIPAVASTARVSMGFWRSGVGVIAESPFRGGGYDSGMAIPATAPSDRRSRLIAAAERVIARDGLDAPVPAIAAEAGVGIGTVYREFPSKETLIAALALERLRWYRAQLASALGEPDAGTALRDLLWRAAERQSSDDLVGHALVVASENSEVREEKRRCERAMGRLLRAAKEQGAIGAGVTLADVHLLFPALRGVIAEGKDWRRAFELLYAGLVRM
jgi:AcrR family transcriptional regulator